MVGKNTQVIHESYLDQKLNENIKELVNFNREIIR